jgi:hypothetical protein
VNNNVVLTSRMFAEKVETFGLLLGCGDAGKHFLDPIGGIKHRLQVVVIPFHRLLSDVMFINVTSRVWISFASTVVLMTGHTGQTTRSTSTSRTRILGK